MADPNQFLLKFDLSKFQDQVNTLTQTYTEFGATLRDVVGSVSDDVTVLQQRAVGISSSMGELIPQMDRSSQSMKMGMGSTMRDMESLSQSSASIANQMTMLSAMQGEGEIDAASSPQMIKAFSAAEMVLDMAGIARSTAQEVEDQINATEDRLKKLDSIFTKAGKKLVDYAKAELWAPLNAAKGLLKSIPGVGGGVMSTLIGWMTLGVKEDARRAAEKGEMRNVFEATGEALYGEGSSEKIVNWFTAFKERAQWFYGISKEESLSVANSLVQAGYKSGEIGKRVTDDLKVVGENSAMMSIALDKHLNIATGTSMNNAIDIVAKYGGELDKVTMSYVGMTMTAQDTTIGVDRFINAVMAGASALQQYGIDIENVGSMILNVEKHYKRMGLDPHMAGAQATKIVEGMMGGLASLGEGDRAILAQRMYPELGAAAALVKYEEGAARAAAGEDDEFVMMVTQNFVRLATEGRERTQAILWARDKAPAMGYMEASAMIDMKDELTKHHDFSKLSKEHQERLRSSMETESTKISKLQKLERELINVLRSVGGGLLQVLSGLLGMIAVMMTSTYRMVSALFLPEKSAVDELQKIGNHIKGMVGIMSSGVDKTVENLAKVPSVLSGSFQDIFSPLQAVLANESAQKTALGDPRERYYQLLAQMRSAEDPQEVSQARDQLAEYLRSLGFEEMARLNARLAQDLESRQRPGGRRMLVPKAFVDKSRQRKDGGKSVSAGQVKAIIPGLALTQMQAEVARAQLPQM